MNVRIILYVILSAAFTFGVFLYINQLKYLDTKHKFELASQDTNKIVERNVNQLSEYLKINRSTL